MFDRLNQENEDKHHEGDVDLDIAANTDRGVNNSERNQPKLVEDIVYSQVDRNLWLQECARVNKHLTL